MLLGVDLHPGYCFRYRRETFARWAGVAVRVVGRRFTSCVFLLVSRCFVCPLGRDGFACFAVGFGVGVLGSAVLVF